MKHISMLLVVASFQEYKLTYIQVRMDPRNQDTDYNNLKYETPNQLTEEEIKKHEGGYIYPYHYNGGGASQVWLGSGRFVVIDISAGPCTYGKIEIEEGTVSSKTLPRLRNAMFSKGSLAANDHSPTHDNFIGQLAALIGITVQHVIAPDVSHVQKHIHENQCLSCRAPVVQMMMMMMMMMMMKKQVS